MRRRHLRLQSSSDEDDAPVDPHPDPNPSSHHVEVSDDEFVDVPDAFSPPSPPHIPSSAAARSTNEVLRRLGLSLRREWLDSCLSSLAGAVPRFETLDATAMAKMCFEEFLLSDMNHSGAGVLPDNVCSMHKVELEGPFVLQIDEIVNISSSLRERYRDAPAGLKRCLKLYMTDGHQHVVGMEYRPMKELDVLASAGLKIVIRNVQIRRGLLMLVPEVLEVLGGLVWELDEARKRLVEEINKPPRGKRKQHNLPLSQRASLTAWSVSVINNTSEANNSIAQRTINPQRVTQESNIRESIIQQFVEPPYGGNTTEEFVVPQTEGNVAEVIITPSARGSNLERHASADNSSAPEPRTTSCIVSDVDDHQGAEYQFFLSGEKEIPFTYLASLFAKWTAEKDREPVIHGKIKCFLTGVKGFQFKQRSTFELRVYVDDGSLISEVVIDHPVVQMCVGHSPEEVSAALSSSDKRIVTEMRETMKSFQLYLARFEGTMLVKISESSSVPVAVEMNQGCSTADAWMLLRRLKMFTAPQTARGHNLDPIELSP
ncbi:putative recQ-mediated genome instability protein [Dioscorea sansibarensis]